VSAKRNAASRGNGGSAEEVDQALGLIGHSHNASTIGTQLGCSTTAKRRLKARLELFSIRAVENWHHVLDGTMLKCDCTDLLYDSAIASGLADEIGGHGPLQKLLAVTFSTACAEHDCALAAAAEERHVMGDGAAT
jgi:hypothetical protein